MDFKAVGGSFPTFPSTGSNTRHLNEAGNVCLFTCSIFPPVSSAKERKPDEKDGWLERYIVLGF